MNNLTRKIELASHLAIIVVAALISVILVKNYFFSDSGSKSVASADSKSAPSVVAPAAGNPGSSSLVGTKIAIPDLDLAKSDKTLVVAISTECHFCSESAPFYKQLVQKRAGQKNLRLVAVLTQPVESGRKYLDDLGVSVDEIRQLSPKSIGVRGTPTLLLVNKEGVITDVWLGKLAPDAEAQVLSRL